MKITFDGSLIPNFQGELKELIIPNLIKIYVILGIFMLIPQLYLQSTYRDNLPVQFNLMGVYALLTVLLTVFLFGLLIFLIIVYTIKKSDLILKSMEIIYRLFLTLIVSLVTFMIFYYIFALIYIIYLSIMK